MTLPYPNFLSELMNERDDLYKRDQDQKWRESLNEWRAAMTASENTQNERLDDHDEDIEVIKEILEGKPSDKDDFGLKGDIDFIKEHLRRLDGVMWPDATGNVGMYAKVNSLVKKEDREERRYQVRWQTWGLILVAVIGNIALVITNMDRIVPTLKRFFLSNRTQVEQKKPGRRHRRPQSVAEPLIAPGEDESQ